MCSDWSTSRAQQKLGRQQRHQIPLASHFWFSRSYWSIIPATVLGPDQLPPGEPVSTCLRNSLLSFTSFLGLLCQEVRFGRVSGRRVNTQLGAPLTKGDGSQRGTLRLDQQPWDAAHPVPWALPRDETLVSQARADLEVHLLLTLSLSCMTPPPFTSAP